MTEFLPVGAMSSCCMGTLTGDAQCGVEDHPGGPGIIWKYAGRDATAVYEPLHPPDTLDKNLPPEKHLGDVDTTGAASLKAAQASKQKTKDELRVEEAIAKKPRINRMLSLQDIEVGERMRSCVRRAHPLRPGRRLERDVVQDNVLLRIGGR